jgi:RAQPRD family integrative conjugative element protein
MRGVVIGVLLAGTVLSAPSAQAEPTSAGERQLLAQLAGEIDVLERLIISAERRANREARFAFDYDDLRSLLDDARQRIDIYLEIERRQPRDLISDVEG